jgi:hypothetical protein
MLKAGYQSHYVVTSFTGMPASPKKQNTFDEIIVNQEVQVREGRGRERREGEMRAGRREEEEEGRGQRFRIDFEEEGSDEGEGRRKEGGGRRGGRRGKKPNF